MTGSADTAGAYAVGTVFSNAVRTDAISAIFSDAETLQRALGTTFGDTVRAYTIGTIFSDDRGGGLRDGYLRQGKGTGGQGGEDKAGEDLLFHVRSPEKG